MKLKSYLASLGLAFILGLALLPPCTMATGEDGADTSDQDQEPEEGQKPGDDQGDDEGEASDPGSDDSGDSSDTEPGNSTIGGGMNSDSEGSQAQPPSGAATPSKPTTPTIPKPTLPSVVPGLSTSQTTTNNSHSQGTSGALTTAPTDAESEISPDESEPELPVLPTAPNDNIAPIQVETPNTGSQETPEINLAAVALLAIAGVTIMSAGIFVAIMQKAASRQAL